MIDVPTTTIISAFLNNHALRSRALELNPGQNKHYIQTILQIVKPQYLKSIYKIYNNVRFCTINVLDVFNVKALVEW